MKSTLKTKLIALSISIAPMALFANAGINITVENHCPNPVIVDAKVSNFHVEVPANGQKFLGGFELHVFFFF